MAALQCEICGGKLMAKAGGLFECEYCGMQYDKTRIQEMVQEIKGTVKVEGTVEVKGTVKLDGPVEVKGGATVDSLLQKGFIAVSRYGAKEAKEAFDKVLDIDPTNGDAYVGLLMAEERITDRKDYKEALMLHRLDHYGRFSQMLKCKGSPEFEAEVKAYHEQNTEQECRYAIHAAQGMERSEEYARLRQLYEPITHLVSEGGYDFLDEDGLSDGKRPVQGSDVLAIFGYNVHLLVAGEVIKNSWDGQKTLFQPEERIKKVMEYSRLKTDTYLGLREDGTVAIYKENGEHELVDQLLSLVADWENIVELAKHDNNVCGIREDGTVLLAKIGEKDSIELPVQGVVAACTGYNFNAFLKCDGTVEIETKDASQRHAVKEWTDIIQLSSDRDYLAGLRADGTVVAAFGLQSYLGSYRGRYGKTEKIGQEISQWTDIVAIKMIDEGVLAVKRDGTLVAVGKEAEERLKKHPDARLFQDADRVKENLQRRRDRVQAAAMEKQRIAEEKHQARISALNREKETLSTELRNLKGLFIGKRRREIEARLAEIESVLKGL